MTILRSFCVCLFLFFSGCAVNSDMVALTPTDESIARDLFRETVGHQKKCSPWVDAEVNVTIDSTFSSGTFDGYLQAMTPAYLKFVGMNPFGQPLLALTSDGTFFQYISFTAHNYYEGMVKARKVARFTPGGFDLADGFYWIIGRIAPADLSIVKAGGDVSGRGFWVELVDHGKDQRSRILFDPKRKVILDHILLDSTGGIAMKAEYSDHEAGYCGLPATIVISGDEYPGRVVLRFNDWRSDTPFATSDFKLEIPADFRRDTVN